ncbi:hypothetical protein N8330_02075 [Gammaproteobacteria bacterium]|jgi:hypothetical protein|nr:hypothetical protein [Gammaproteobacteria bacterium]
MFFNSTPRIIAKLQLIGLVTAIIIKIILVLSGLEYLISDLGVYEAWSQDILSHVEPNHLPLLPFLVMLITKISFGIISPLLAMQILALMGWLLSVPIFSKILTRIVDPKLHDHALILLCFYPLFGFSFVLYPAPDKLAHLMFGISLLCLVSSLDKRILIVSAAVGLIIHKAMWPYFILLSLLGISQKYLKPIDLIYIALPISIYYLSILITQNGVQLGILGNLNSDLMINASVLPFEGLMNALVFDDINSIIKSLYLIVLTILAGILMVENIYNQRILNVLLLIPIVIMSMFIVPFVATGYLRHSLFIIFPLFSSSFLTGVQGWVYAISKNFLILILMCSQILFILKCYNYDLLIEAWKLAKHLI